MISFDEFYAGDCPPGINPTTGIELDLARLGEIAEIMIRERGYVPA